MDSSSVSVLGPYAMDDGGGRAPCKNVVRAVRRRRARRVHLLRGAGASATARVAGVSRPTRGGRPVARCLLASARAGSWPASAHWPTRLCLDLG